MQPFDRYFRDKMKDSAFKALYEAECHVCATTMEIVAKAEIETISLTDLARDVNADPQELEMLRDADHCNPDLVVRLCRRLGLREPASCPRRKKAQPPP